MLFVIKIIYPVNHAIRSNGRFQFDFRTEPNAAKVEHGSFYAKFDECK